MSYKTLPIVFLSIVLLTVLMLLVLEPPGGSVQQSDTGVVDSEYSLNERGSLNTNKSNLALEPLKSEIRQVSDIEECQKLAKKIDTAIAVEDKRVLLELLLSYWLKLDTVSGLNFARSVKVNQHAGVLLGYAIHIAGGLNFTAVVGWINSLDTVDVEKESLINTLYYGIGNESPISALKFIDLVDNLQVKKQIMQALLHRWYAQDSQSTLAWLDARKPDPYLEEIKIELTASVPKNSLDETGEQIRNMKTGQDKNKLTRDHANKLAGISIEQATNWARSLDDPESYKIALVVVFEEWVKQEPDKRKIFEELLTESDSNVRDHLLNEVSLDIAAGNPKDLAAMIDMVPTSAQPEIAEKVVRFWRGRNPQETVDWVSELHPGTTRDHATVAITDHLLNIKKFDQAIQLVSKVQDGLKQYETSAKVFMSMYENDPEKARNAIGSADYLSNRQREELIAMMENRSK